MPWYWYMLLGVVIGLAVMLVRVIVGKELEMEDEMRAQREESAMLKRTDKVAKKHECNH